MFNVYFGPSVPGFHVKPYDEVPGFNIDENGKPVENGLGSIAPILGPRGRDIPILQL
jgi:hypothetical protein